MYSIGGGFLRAVELVREALDEAVVHGDLVALDPGGQTGWARYSKDRKWSFGVIQGADGIEEVLNGASLVVTESFVLLPFKMKKATPTMLSPLKVLGAVEHVCSLKGIEIVSVTPAERAAAKELAEKVIDKKLPRHSREAAQALICFVVKHLVKEKDKDK